MAIEEPIKQIIDWSIDGPAALQIVVDLGSSLDVDIDIGTTNVLTIKTVDDTSTTIDAMHTLITDLGIDFGTYFNISAVTGSGSTEWVDRVVIEDGDISGDVQQNIGHVQGVMRVRILS